MDINTRIDVNVLWDLLDTLEKLRLSPSEVSEMYIDTGKDRLGRIKVGFAKKICVDKYVGDEDES